MLQCQACPNTFLCFPTVQFILACQTIFVDHFFNSLLFQAETYMICANVLYVLIHESSVGSDKEWETHRPYCKNRTLLVVKVGDFYSGYMVNWHLFCRIHQKFCFWLHKNVVTYHIYICIGKKNLKQETQHKNIHPPLKQSTFINIQTHIRHQSCINSLKIHVRHI